MAYVLFIRRDVFGVEPGLGTAPFVGPDLVALLESADVLTNSGNDSSAVSPEHARKSLAANGVFAFPNLYIPDPDTRREKRDENVLRSHFRNGDCVNCQYLRGAVPVERRRLHCGDRRLLRFGHSLFRGLARWLL